MKLIVFGATGATGRLIVQKALAAGHDVTAFVRDATRMALEHTNLNVIEGNLQNPVDVETAAQGHNAVICALGAPLMNKDRVRSLGTQSIINAMHNTHVNRLICLSSYGAGDSYEHLSPLYRFGIVPMLLRRVLDDHNAQENIVRRSGLQWTIVRPVNLTNGPATGDYISGIGKPEQKLSMKISREDVSNYIIRQLGDSTNLHKAPFMSYGTTRADQSICAPRKSRA